MREHDNKEQSVTQGLIDDGCKFLLAAAVLKLVRGLGCISVHCTASSNDRTTCSSRRLCSTLRIHL